MRRFKPSDVEQLAATLAANQNTPRNAEKIAARAAELSNGELAALVFERLEQRHSLAEIVIALRVPPDDVRELYRAWLVGEQDAVRKATPDQLGRLLAALPDGRSTRISVARVVGEYMLPDNTDKNGTSFVEYRNLPELGGFVVAGPTAISEITQRVGAGEYRVSAYGLCPRDVVGGFRLAWGRTALRFLALLAPRGDAETPTFVSRKARATLGRAL